MPVAKLSGPQTVVMKDITEYSSGLSRLPLGKVDSRLLRCIINSGKGMALHDSTYSKTCATPMQGVTVDLDIKSNNVTDKSGNSNHPSNLNNVTLQNGKADFNGVDSSITIPTNASFKTSSYSIYIRFRLNAIQSYLQRLADSASSGSSGGFQFEINNSTNKVSLNVIDTSNSIVGSLSGATSISPNVIYDVVATVEKYVGSNLGRIAIYVNGVLDNGTSEATGNFLAGGASLFIGNIGFGGNRAINGSIYAFKMFDHALSPAEVKALSDQRTALYPSQDSLDFTVTQTSVKDLQWFIRNSPDGKGTNNITNSIIETNSIVIVEDSASASWVNSTSQGTLSDDSVIFTSGVNSLKFVFTNLSNNAGIHYIYGSVQNWSAMDVLNFRWYGRNTGNSITVGIGTSTNNDENLTNGYYLSFTDNFSGWANLSFLIKNMTSAGTPDLTSIRKVVFKSNTAGTITGTWNIDRLTVGVCPSIPVKKLSIDGLYLENQLEESPVSSDVLQLFDDSVSAWSNAGFGQTGGSYSQGAIGDDTTTKIKGVSSMYQTSAAGTYTQCRFKHAYGSSQDWSAYDFISLYVWGNNTGQNNTVQIAQASWTWYRTWYIADNFSGWKRFVLPLRYSPNADTGTVNIAAVDLLQITFIPTAIGQTFRIDRVILQKGRWIFVEVAVPDTLYQYQGYLSINPTAYDISYVELNIWNGSSYGSGYIYFPSGAGNANITPNIGLMKFLDGSVFQTIYGEPNSYTSVNSISQFIPANRGFTKTRITSYLANQSITYNGIGGCRRRIGFAIKMPPTDNSQSSTTGISQAKLKLDVYVP